MQSKIMATALFTVLAALVSFGMLALLGPDWARYLPANCLATHCFCETPRTGALVLQPANSWSSFGFAAIGFWMILTARDRSQSAFTGLPALWFGVTAIIIGIGSFALHATLTLLGQFFDVLGMYLTSAFMIAYAVHRWGHWNGRASILLYLALCTILIALLIIVPETRRWLFALVLIVAIVLELGFARPKRPGVEMRWFMYGLALQSVAFAIWVLDLRGVLCNGASLLQGHAAWHFLSAAALWCNYLYYRSERTS
jgi:Ceramidase